ncbi:bacterial transcriptional activator domain-containing protein [Dactylosporangium sp. NPDC051485]|uniref:AfsR/SARP family transcriptional regulator n=1 Tax=Dactylosporangium sp. NPDC051485 TaxID=3154846 RepID=UPI00342781D7
MNGLSVRLFGIPSVHRSGRETTRIPAKSLELFCFLLIHHERGSSRELLSEFLWPDESGASSKRYLRQALWKLNAALNRPSEGIGEELVDSSSPGWLQINSRAAVWTDVNEFDQAYSGLLADVGENLSDAEGRAMEKAIGLYRGELLAGWPQEWCLPERARFEQAYLVMLEKLMTWCRVRQLGVKAVGYGELALRHDPARESVHRQLMSLHYANGNRGEAVRQYQSCADVLGRELGVGPSAQTRELYEQILRDEVPSTTTLTTSPARREPAPDLALHARLDEIQASLQELIALVGRHHRGVG